MPLIYGEGRDNAFKRLRQEIDKSSNEDRLLKSHEHVGLGNVMKEIRETSLQTYLMILKMQTTLPPQVERQQPVHFLDACGVHAPFHLEFINCWEAFLAVLKVRFERRSLRVVEKKRYVLFPRPAGEHGCLFQ